MINIYDNVNAVASDLVKTEQYTALQVALNEMHADKEAEAIFKRFQAEQQTMQAAIQGGTEPSEDQIKSWQAVAADMDTSDVLKKLMAAEGAMNNLLQEVNEIVTKPIAELYK
ncbi:YlbF family regulator [Weissella koreensis]|uniref:Uncharacterized protein n=1 Tax=Weissella koreensis TaxID=165096 RepID=A0A7H1MKM2_9LACO|nr:YlbF family regulator [Weissella koreensis]AEJ23161.1 hypothetical protein WKK_01425 [Weissella koreensis KACC 15510]AVH74805.1 hypothetical protein C4597_01695 [Weissella koreensis]EJF33762.1 protein of hypothetical function DUF964 [Weissella koreensis KCTC 3621]QGN20029.1 hypothetical protein GKC51_01670 [Weissella koreensis]QNT64008.1 hypothetical protein FY536_01395 [Weissella koreensis]